MEPRPHRWKFTSPSEAEAQGQEAQQEEKGEIGYPAEINKLYPDCGYQHKKQ